MFLGCGDLAIEPAEEIDQPGVVVEMGFGVIGGSEFLEEDLGEAGGGGLQTDFTEFRGIVATQEIEEVTSDGVMECWRFSIFDFRFSICSGGGRGFLYRFFTDLTARRGALDPRIGVIWCYQVICGDRKR